MACVDRCHGGDYDCPCPGVCAPTARDTGHESHRLHRPTPQAGAPVRCPAHMAARLDALRARVAAEPLRVA